MIRVRIQIQMTVTVHIHAWFYSTCGVITESSPPTFVRNEVVGSSPGFVQNLDLCPESARLAHCHRRKRKTEEGEHSEHSTAILVSAHDEIPGPVRFRQDSFSLTCSM